MLLRFVPGLAIRELRVTKPRTFRDVNESGCRVCNIRRDDTGVIVGHLGQLRHPRNDQNRLGAGRGMKQPALKLIGRKRSERSIELRAGRRNLSEDVLRR